MLVNPCEMLENPKANSSTIYNRCESGEKELDYSMVKSWPIERIG